MKRTFLFTALFFVFPLIAYAQYDQWIKVDFGSTIESACTDNDGGIYVGTYGADVYYLAPDSVRWQKLNESQVGFINHPITSIAFAEGKLYAASGHGYDLGRSILISKDHGKTWIESKSIILDSFKGLLIVKDDVYAAFSFAASGLAKINDGGEIEYQENAGLPRGLVYSYVVRDNDVFAATADGIFKTQNCGKKWELVSTFSHSDQLVVSKKYFFSVTPHNYLARFEAAEDSVTLFAENVTRIGVDRQNRLFAAMHDSIAMTSETGKSWTEVLPRTGVQIGGFIPHDDHVIVLSKRAIFRRCLHTDRRHQN